MQTRKWLLRVAIGGACLTALLFSCLLVLRHQRRADIAGEQVRETLQVESTSFVNGATIPRALTCEGANLPPELHWTSPPSATKSLALVMEDTDAPLGFVHWLLYDIPATTVNLPDSPQNPPGNGSVAGANSAGAIGYFGPCPPDARQHRYTFKVYALDVNPGLPPGQSKQELAAAAKSHVLAEGQMIGLYAKSNY